MVLVYESARAILVTDVHRRATLSSVDARVTFCHFDHPSPRDDDDDDDVVLLNYALGNGTCFESARAILVTEVHRRAPLSSVDARMTFCHFDCSSSWTASA